MVAAIFIFGPIILCHLIIFFGARKIKIYARRLFSSSFFSWRPLFFFQEAINIPFPILVFHTAYLYYYFHFSSHIFNIHFCTAINLGLKGKIIFVFSFLIFSFTFLLESYIFGKLKTSSWLLAFWGLRIVSSLRSKSVEFFFYFGFSFLYFSFLFFLLHFHFRSSFSILIFLGFSSFHFSLYIFWFSLEISKSLGVYYFSILFQAPLWLFLFSFGFSLSFSSPFFGPILFFIFSKPSLGILKHLGNTLFLAWKSLIFLCHFLFHILGILFGIFLGLFSLFIFCITIKLEWFFFPGILFCTLFFLSHILIFKVNYFSNFQESICFSIVVSSFGVIYFSWNPFCIFRIWEFRNFICDLGFCCFIFLLPFSIWILHAVYFL